MTKGPLPSNSTQRAKLSRALTKHLIADFEANGSELIAKMRTGKPLDYLKLVSTLLDEERDKDGGIKPFCGIVERHIIAPENRHG